MGLNNKAIKEKYNLAASIIYYFTKKGYDIMSRYKQGNPKRKSRFICCKCLQENMVGSGIQREHGQREKNHIKDLYCVIDNEVTKNLEVRFCDDYNEMKQKANALHDEYYNKNRKVG